MSDLISRDTAFEIITDFAGKASTKSAYSAFWKCAKALKNMPTVDAVPVVRCGECIYNRSVNCDAFPCRLTGAYPMHSNDFCSYGERKDGEN